MVWQSKGNKDDMESMYGSLDPSAVMLENDAGQHLCSSSDDFSKVVSSIVGKLLAEVPIRSGSFVAKEHARQLVPLQIENFHLRQQLASKTEGSSNAGNDRSFTVVDIDENDPMKSNNGSDAQQHSPAIVDSLAIEHVESGRVSFAKDLRLDVTGSQSGGTRAADWLRGSSAQGRRYELLREWKAGDAGENSAAASVSTYSSESVEGLSFNEEAIVEHHLASVGFHLDKVPHRKWVWLPSSRSRLMWDLLGTVLLCYDLIIIPLGVFDLPKSTFLTTLSWVTLIFWTLDIGASFTTGYYEGTNVVMKPWRIALHYCRTWLLLDVFIVGIDWIGLIFAGGSGKASGIMRAGKLLRILRILRTLRLLRLAKLRSIMRQVQDHMDSDYLTIFMGMLKNILLIVAINHFIACLWFAVGSSGQEDNWITFYGYGQDVNTTIAYQYATSLHWSLTQFTPASMSVQPQNLLERMFAVVVLLFALIVFSSFLSSITSSMTNLRNINAKRDQQFFMLRKFLRQNKISEDLQYRVNRYVQVVNELSAKRLEQKHIELLSVLSNPLIKELQGELYHPKIIIHPFFKRLQRVNHLIIQGLCCNAVKIHGLSTNDVQFSGGDLAIEMYFLTRGFMVYQPIIRGHSHEQCLLRDGEFCSEAVLWTKWHHQGTLKANIECELLGIHSTSFREVILSNPAHSHFPKRYGEAFVRALNEQADEMSLELKGGDSLAHINHIYVSDLQAHLIRSNRHLHSVLSEAQSTLSLSRRGSNDSTNSSRWTHWMEGFSMKTSHDRSHER